MSLASDCKLRRTVNLMKRKEKIGENKETSRPKAKASNCQQFPCPAQLVIALGSSFVAGQRPNRGQSPIEWGDFPSVHLSVCLAGWGFAGWD